MGYWLKLIYNTNRLRDADGWRVLTWVSDHHRGTRANPKQRPQYELGDEIVVYSVYDGVCPARLRVTKQAVFDPDRVDRLGHPGDGRRWGWLTETEVIAVADVDRSPSLFEIGVKPQSIRQGDHRHLNEEQYRRAVRELPGGRKRGRRRSPRPVPLEEQYTEEFEQRFEKRAKAVQRREQKLVRAYGRFLERKGRTVRRHRIPVGEGAHPLYTDAFEEERHNLIEAKVDSTRPAIRMAIGQLADYERFIKPRPRRRAVLLPSRPPADMEALLASQKIHVIWKHGSGFRDNALT